MHTQSPGTPILTLDSVSRDFGPCCALNGLSLAIRSGELVAVIGRSGAGKTTFLRCLSRFTAVSAGTICLRGDDLATLKGAALRAHRRRVG